MDNKVQRQLLLEALADYWEQHPDQRLGQLLYNTIAPVEPCSEIFYIEDRKLRRLLENEL